MPQLFVALVESDGAGHPRVGAERRDLRIEVADRSYGAEQAAIKQAVAAFAADRKIRPDSVLVLGIY